MKSFIRYIINNIEQVFGIIIMIFIIDKTIYTSTLAFVIYIITKIVNNAEFQLQMKFIWLTLPYVTIGIIILRFLILKSLLLIIFLIKDFYLMIIDTYDFLILIKVLKLRKSKRINDWVLRIYAKYKKTGYVPEDVNKIFAGITIYWLMAEYPKLNEAIIIYLEQYKFSTLLKKFLSLAKKEKGYKKIIMETKERTKYKTLTHIAANERLMEKYYYWVDLHETFINDMDEKYKSFFKFSDYYRLKKNIEIDVDFMWDFKYQEACLKQMKGINLIDIKDILRLIDIIVNLAKIRYKLGKTKGDLIKNLPNVINTRMPWINRVLNKINKQNNKLMKKFFKNYNKTVNEESMLIEIDNIKIEYLIESHCDVDDSYEEMYSLYKDQAYDYIKDEWKCYPVIILPIRKEDLKKKEKTYSKDTNNNKNKNKNIKHNKKLINNINSTKKRDKNYHKEYYINILKHDQNYYRHYQQNINKINKIIKKKNNKKKVNNI
uniref:Uncharacterized protein n=1 Tax=Gefionella okellyi TaxID=2853422 RepID=A0A0B5GSH6_9EUKA|nr:hypothetical protein [Gefionella okellyi]